jgi:hypothetical protein
LNQAAFLFFRTECVPACDSRSRKSRLNQAAAFTLPDKAADFTAPPLFLIDKCV